MSILIVLLTIWFWALWKFDRASEPFQNLFEVLRAERSVSEIWIDGLDMPLLPRKDVPYEGTCAFSGRRLGEVLLGLDSGQHRQVGATQLRSHSAQIVSLCGALTLYRPRLS